MAESISGSKVNDILYGLLDENGDAVVEFLSPAEDRDQLSVSSATAKSGGAGKALEVDLLVTNFNDQANQIIFNNGGANFDVAMNTPDPALASPGAVLGDVDEDGDLDAIVVNDWALGNTTTAYNYMLVNRGGDDGGSEGQFGSVELAGGSQPTRQAALGDIDGDGDLDAMLANNSSQMQILINQGHEQGGDVGDFALSGLTIPGLTTYYNVALGDLDGDGDLDVVTTGAEGQGTRTSFNQGGDQEGIEGEFILSSDVYQGGSTRGLTLGDLDNDGDLDIVIGNDRTQLNYSILNQGDGTFGPGIALPGGSNGTFGVALGDVDDDKDLDILVGNTNATSAGHQLLINQGGEQGGTAGTFTFGSTIAAGKNGRGVAFADLDGDGDPDAIMMNVNQANQFALNDGDGNFGMAQDLPGGARWSDFVVAGELGESPLCPPVGTVRAGGEINSDGPKTEAGAGSAIAELSDGKLVVVFGAGSEGRIYDPAADKWGKAFSLFDKNPGEQPTVTALEGKNGGFVVSWQADAEAFARVFNDKGKATTGEINVADSDTFVDEAALPGGGFVIVRIFDGDIYAHNFDDRSQETSPSGGYYVGSGFAGVNDGPEVAALADGSIVAVWSGQDGGKFNVYGQHFQADGSLLKSFETSPTAFNSEDDHPAPSIAALPQGGFVVTWQGQGASRDDIWARQYDGNIDPAGDPFVANTYSANAQWYPSVAATCDGGYVISWSSFNQDGSDWGVYAQRFDMNGEKLQSELPVNDVTSEAQFWSHNIGTGDGGFAILWGDRGDASVSKLKIFESGNNFPNAVDDAYDINAAEIGKNGAPLDVLSNDVAGAAPLDQKSVAIIDNPDHGTATVKKGVIYYTPGTAYEGEGAGTTPENGYEGADTLQYTVADKDGRISDEAVVRLDIRQDTRPVETDPPTAIDDSFEVDVAEIGKKGAVLDILANDIAGGAPLDSKSVEIIDSPDHGTATVKKGVIYYTPETGYEGADTLQYTVADKDGVVSDEAVVRLDIDQPLPPEAVDDSFEVDVAEIGKKGAVLDILANDIAGGAPLDSKSVEIIDNPDHGTATVNKGVIYYTPEASYEGADTLQYTVADKNGVVSDEAVVRLDIDQPPPPDAVDDSFSIRIPTFWLGEPWELSVLLNDVPGNAPLDPKSLQITDDPDHGQAIVKKGEISYTPEGGYEGPAMLKYTVADKDGLVSDEATVTIDVDLPAFGGGRSLTESLTIDDLLSGDNLVSTSTVAPASYGVGVEPDLSFAAIAEKGGQIAAFADPGMSDIIDTVVMSPDLLA